MNLTQGPEGERIFQTASSVWLRFSSFSGWGSRERARAGVAGAHWPCLKSVFQLGSPQDLLAQWTACPGHPAPSGGVRRRAGLRFARFQNAGDGMAGFGSPALWATGVRGGWSEASRVPPGHGPRTLAHTYLLLRQARELLAGGAAVQASDVAQETLRLLDFGQQLVHVPAGTGLGVAEQSAMRESLSSRWHARRHRAGSHVGSSRRGARSSEQASHTGGGPGPAHARTRDPPGMPPAMRKGRKRVPARAPRTRSPVHRRRGAQGSS